MHVIYLVINKYLLLFAANSKIYKSLTLTTYTQLGNTIGGGQNLRTFPALNIIILEGALYSFGVASPPLIAL